MNNTINNYGGANTSFGYLSPQVNQMVKTHEVARLLKKYRVSSADIDSVDRSPLKFSLLSTFFNSSEIPNTSGLVLEPSKRSKLPNMYLTASNGSILKSNSEVFAFCFKKAVDMVKSYNLIKAQMNSHAERKLQTLKVRKLEKDADEVLDRYTKHNGSHESVNLPDLAGELEHLEVQVSKNNQELSTKKINGKKDFCEKVRQAWMQINVRRFDKSA